MLIVDNILFFFCSATRYLLTIFILLHVRMENTKYMLKQLIEMNPLIRENKIESVLQICACFSELPRYSTSKCYLLNLFTRLYNTSKVESTQSLPSLASISSCENRNIRNCLVKDSLDRSQIVLAPDISTLYSFIMSQDITNQHKFK